MDTYIPTSAGERPPVRLLGLPPLAAFVVLAYALAWAIWLPKAAAAAGWLPVYAPPGSPALMAMLIAAAWTPTAAALIVVWHTSGRAEAGRLLRRLLIWRVSPWWYLAALLMPFALAAVAFGVHVLAGGTLPAAMPRATPLDPLFVLLIALPIFVFAGGPLAEELGWRGYALPRLQAHMGPIRASLLVGVVWSLWHLPTLVFPGSGQYGFPLHLYVLHLTAISILMTWVVNGAGGSVLLAVLFHAAHNTTLALALPVIGPDGVDEQLVGILVTVEWACALLVMGRLRHSVRDAADPVGAGRLQPHDGAR